jgi:hypothetical protein
VLEEILVEFVASLTAAMLAVPPINISKDAMQSATLYANSRDGSGVLATHIATAPPLDMEALLFVLRSNPTYHERAKEVMQAVEQSAASKK